MANFAMSVADELALDLLDSGSEHDEDENSQEIKQEEGLEDRGRDEEEEDGADLMDLKGEEEDNENVEFSREDFDKKELALVDDETKGEIEQMNLTRVDDVRNVAKLMSTLQPVLDKIQAAQPEGSAQVGFRGSLNDHPEYTLLTSANTFSTQVDSEMLLVHKFIRDHYSIRFPELETLLQNPLQYAKAVAIIGNGPMDKIKEIASKSDNMVGTSLDSLLDGGSRMVVHLEATQTRGRELTNVELQTVLRACEMMLSLDKAKGILNSFVQSRMTKFAPNLTQLIGSVIAAQLVNLAGGLSQLANTPACNIPGVGSQKNLSSAHARNVGIRRQGFLYASPLIQMIPDSSKKQALRIVSGKVILAARVDSVHSSPDGSTGLNLYDEVTTRLHKLREPPPNTGPKALPAPDDKPSRKRGGRRIRKMKEATAMTDIRRAQNRMRFGEEEASTDYGVGDSSVGLGMLGEGKTSSSISSGQIRAIKIDKRTAAKLSKKNPGWAVPGATPNGLVTPMGGAGAGSGMASSVLRRGLTGASSFGVAGNATALRAQGIRTSGIGGSGTASSIAFTPVQGLELVDPKVQAELKRKRAAEEDRWFKSGTFTQAGGGVKVEPRASVGVKDKDGFKVPALPIKKVKTEQ